MQFLEDDFNSKIFGMRFSEYDFDLKIFGMQFSEDNFNLKNSEYSFQNMILIKKIGKRF